MPRCRSSRSGRSRGDQQLVPGEPLTPRRACAQEIRRSQRPAAGGAGEPRVSTNICRCASRRPSGAHLPARSPTDRCSTFSCSTCAAIAAQRRRPGGKLWAGGVLPRSDPGGLAQARADDVAGDLEGDRRRHADRPRRGLRHRPQMGRGSGSPKAMARRAAASSKSPTFFPSSSGGHPQYALAHRRRALHGGALLRSHKAVFQDFEPFWEFVSGPIHAGSFPQNALDNTFGPQRVYVKAPGTPNAPPSEACSSSAM